MLERSAYYVVQNPATKMWEVKQKVNGKEETVFESSAEAVAKAHADNKNAA